LDHTVPRREIEGASRRGGCLVTAIFVIIALFLIRFLASLAIDYEWWKEMGQVPTWIATWTYTYAPTAAATIIAFIILWIAHARALKHARTGLGEHPIYARLSTLVLLVFSFLLALGAMDSWTVVRYFGGRTLAHNPSEWHDPVFNQALAFYLFDLPFYRVLLALVLTIVAAAAILYWVAARLWQLRGTVSDWSRIQSIDIGHFTLTGVLESVFVRLLSVVFLVALAIRCYLGRYGMALNEHGFMVGIDYVNQYFGLPLQWLLILCCLLAAAAMVAQRATIALALLVGSFLLRAVVPSVVAAVYVRPNEISLEKPFIDRHIRATRAAYGIDSRTSEVEFHAEPEALINVAENRQLLDNVRLWDMKAFRETVAQIQPLRPYVYSNVDVDRYPLGGEIRQVLVSPRELDLNGLGDARLRWINPHFIYTHGYGLVMAEANKITANGLPVLFIKDAPPVITTPGLTLNRPEIYFGELDQDPVFVRTAQAEFNYPAGGQNVQTRYDGHGGFPISSLPLRTAAAISEGDWNILLTSYLTPESRMMIHRQVTDRLETLAGFLTWDPDPYMVLGKDGRLVWIVDGYMTSDVHPYSKSVEFEGLPAFNYIRNSVKATVDAYDGTVKLYVFDPSDPLISAYMNLFPALFQPASAMPADIRAHVRYPEMIFRAQAEIYRTFHMRDPETFYNKSDAWDVAKFTTSQSGNPEPMPPNYVIATVPGQKKPEFLLMIPFTPRNRDNLIGLMMARCDGEHLGEKFVLLLSKQEIILGPMQVEARINQDQNISKDLTLWNQQGSQVLRGQMLVLPIENTFLYVEPIYLQASQAKMPQLKKVALAMGNTLIYSDTYEEALAQLGGMNQAPVAPTAQALPAAAGVPPGEPARPSSQTDPRVEQIRQHFQRYRDLTAQGKWVEAGRELEAIQAIVGK
jgi:uncharacterized membrane protein (UPF0182 family)